MLGFLHEGAGVRSSAASTASATTPSNVRAASKGLVVMRICNHCPYVKGSIDRIIADCGELQQRGIGSIAVMSNDPAR